MVSTTSSLFRVETRRDPASGRIERFQSVTCTKSGCDSVMDIPARTAATGGLPDAVIVKKAQAAGWRITRGGRTRVCESCQSDGRPHVFVHRTRDDDHALDDVMFTDRDPPEKREAIRDSVRVRAVLDSGSATLPELESRLAEPATAEILDAVPLQERNPMDTPSAPRAPSREDKRKILDRLAEVYVGEEIGYSKDWTDAKLAASLSMPTAWVTDLRVEFHGDNAGNEAADGLAKERRRLINECRADIDRIEKKGLETLADMERQLAGVRARLDRIETGGEPVTLRIAK